MSYSKSEVWYLSLIFYKDRGVAVAIDEFDQLQDKTEIISD